MSTPSDVLINLEGVTKVFYTDEVETHALAGIHLQIRNGEYLAIAGPSGAASRRCSRFWACSIRRRTARTSSTTGRSPT